MNEEILGFQNEDEQNKFLLYKYLQKVGFDEPTAEKYDFAAQF